MKFAYTSITNTGETRKGIQEASDKFTLARDLRGKGERLLSARPANEKKWWRTINISFGGVKEQDKIIFARNLSAMVGAGLPLSRAMDILERQTKSTIFKKIIVDLGETIRKGGTLSEGMEKHAKTFSSLFRAMVRAGEESGGLPNSLKIIANQLEKSYLLKKKIKGALIYPAIIVIAMIIVGILMLFYVVPTLTATFKELNIDLPATTQAIITVSDFITGHTILFFGALFALVAGTVFFFRTPRGRRVFEWSILRIPVIGMLVKKTNSARTTRTLASLLSSGVDIVDAIDITRDVIQNSYYREVLDRAQKNIQKGIPLSDAFGEAEHLYPVLVGEMTEVGEETGKLTEMFIQIADFYEEEVGRATKDLTTIIEPVLMIIVGVVVGFFAIAMISPTYSLLEGI